MNAKALQRHERDRLELGDRPATALAFENHPPQRLSRRTITTRAVVARHQATATCP